MSWTALALWLGGINLVTFAAFWLDKRRASRKGRRIPERRLLWLAALGGTPAARLAQKYLRHKTTKQPFARRLLAIHLLHGAMLIAAALYWMP